MDISSLLNLSNLLCTKGPCNSLVTRCPCNELFMQTKFPVVNVLQRNVRIEVSVKCPYP